MVAKRWRKRSAHCGRLLYVQFGISLEKAMRSLWLLIVRAGYHSPGENEALIVAVDCVYRIE